ncbi:MAG: hypothetical protein AB7F30_03390 [Flavobacteriaceae bacterium]
MRDVFLDSCRRAFMVRPQQKRGKPGYDGKAPDIATRQVVNPLGYHGAREFVTVNLSEHPLERMYNRGDLDSAQKEAADRIRANFEIMGMAGAGAIDYSAVRVDGGGKADSFSERKLRAGHDIKHVETVCGRIAFIIIRMICGEGRTIDQVAGLIPGGASQDTRRKHVSGVLKSNLTLMAIEWHYEKPAAHHPFRAGPETS